MLGDFNAEDTEPILSEFLEQYEAKNIMKNESCFKNPDRPTCIDVFLTNSPHSFHNTMTISTGLSDFQGMIITVLKSSFIKLMARETYYRDYKNFSTKSHQNMKIYESKNTVAANYRRRKEKKIDTHKTMDNKTFRKQLYPFYF